MSKKRKFAAFLNYTGLLWLMEHLPGKPYVLILNFHRVGDKVNTDFDKALFSATEESFEESIAFLSKQYNILNASDIQTLHTNSNTISKPSIVVTFDDGYRDNYENAFPILKKYSMPGIFFIPTYVLEKPVIPWWDSIAFMINSSNKPSITIKFHNEQHSFNLEQSKELCIRQVLRIVKDADTIDYTEFLTMLSSECGVVVNEEVIKNSNLFMTDEMLKEMHDAGMIIGSHTHDHFVLSHLSTEKQLEQLKKSKEILEEIIGSRINTLAYPVGGKVTFTEDTKKAANRLGYDLGFSFYGGLVSKDHQDWLDITREFVDFDDSIDLMRARIQFRRLFNIHI